ncbi:MAG TPA: nuclear transport factor 2 family protein [Pararobbsia sp.]|jgi:predicted SnoaL-like aldol condensation-catalyzing enzyme|nr:nuclear transport factor 2 family protein [Pararobbsia sp.]
MSKIKLFLFALVATLAAATACAEEPSQLEKNKAAVVALYNKALNEKDVEGAIALMGPTYTQHNARIADGKEGFRQFFEDFKKRYPNSHSEILRVIAEGDYVVLHVHMVNEPGQRGVAVFDLFRLENGKPVEHWDVLQPVPESIPHNNTMF